ncbi:MAG TPA: hypothetical protein VF613_26075 [Longimicrobium sp.]|jgi:hypothetical protein
MGEANHSGSTPNLEAPETIRDLSALTPEQLARAAELLQRELEAPQTPTCRRVKQVTLRRIELRLGRRGADRRPMAPRPPRRRPGSHIWNQTEIQSPDPSRTLDAFLSTLDGWNLDWTDPDEIERVGVPVYGPERALSVLLRAFEAGLLARPQPDIEPDAASVEQLVLPIREAA